MKLVVCHRIHDLAQQSGQEYGKLVQKLLAIAFCESGAKRVTERSIQGIDLEVVLADGRQLALEVKTTITGKVTFGQKDTNGLIARKEQGLTPYFAVLGSRLIDDWLFAQYFQGEIPARDYSPTRLRPYRDSVLEAMVRPHFEEAVVRHTQAAIDGGWGAD